jgi:hypothetical protein
MKHEASRHFSHKKKEYHKEKIHELPAKSKNMNIQSCIEE